MTLARQVALDRLQHACCREAVFSVVSMGHSQRGRLAGTSLDLEREPKPSPPKGKPGFDRLLKQDGRLVLAFRRTFIANEGLAFCKGPSPEAQAKAWGCRRRWWPAILDRGGPAIAS